MSTITRYPVLCITITTQEVFTKVFCTGESIRMSSVISFLNCTCVLGSVSAYAFI